MVTPANGGVYLILIINKLGDACMRRHDSKFSHFAEVSILSKFFLYKCLTGLNSTAFLMACQSFSLWPYSSTPMPNGLNDSGLTSFRGWIPF